MENVQVQEMPAGLKNFLKPAGEESTELKGTETSGPPAIADLKLEDKKTETQVKKEEPVKETEVTDTDTDTTTISDTKEVVEETVAVDTNDNWLSSDVNAPEAKTDPAMPSLEEKAKILDGLLANKEVQMVLDAFRAGKTLADITKDIQTVDYSSMPVDALAKSYGELRGWTADEVEGELTRFSDLTKTQQEDVMERWQNKLNESQSGRIEKISGGYKQDASKIAADHQRISQKFSSDIEKEVALMSDKELFGAKITPEQASGFRDWVNNLDYTNADGTFNTAKLRNFYIGEVLLPSIQKANYAKGKSEGTTEVLKQVHRPQESSAAATKLPQPKTSLSEAEKAQKAFDAIMNGQVKPM